MHPRWAAIVGQPHNSIIICRVRLGQATSQLYQRTGIDDVRHRLWLSTGTQVRVDLSPSLPAGTAMTLRSAEVIQEGPLSSREVKTLCGIVESISKWKSTTEAKFQSFLDRLPLIWGENLWGKRHSSVGQISFLSPNQQCQSTEGHSTH